MARVDRRTVDLSGYPDLIVIYLGLRVNAVMGIKKALGLGPQIAKSAADKPDGLLLHEDLLFSLFPPHLGMRQYWRDFESLERWTRSEPHRQWWKDFLRESGGTGFWHETYSIRGGIEAMQLRITELETAMKDAARRLDFERAAELRDRIKALRKVDLGV